MSPTHRPCDNCAVARGGFPEYRLYNPACLYCGARHVRLLENFATGEALKVRRRAAVAYWKTFGHDTKTLVDMAKAGPLPIEPENKPKRKAKT